MCRITKLSCGELMRDSNSTTKDYFRGALPCGENVQPGLNRALQRQTKHEGMASSGLSVVWLRWRSLKSKKGNQNHITIPGY